MGIGIARKRVVLAAAAIVALGSCTPSQTASQSSSTSKKLQIVTTILPITEFTKGVAGERAEVTQLLPTTVEPHDFQAKPEDAQKLAKADVVVENGLELESYLDDLIKNAGQSQLKVIDSSQNIQPIANDAFEGHSNHTSPQIGNPDHEGKYNPHIWLDPERAVQQVENIRDGLIAADPGGQDIYTANAAAYIAKLNQLNADFAQALKPYAGRTFVTYHDFAPYFAQRYNLKAQFLVGVPEENPSPEDVKRVISAAKNSNLKMLLTEPQAAGNPFEALANDLNVQVSNFDSLEVSNAEGMQPDYYFTVMRQNLKNLETALGQPQSLLPVVLPSLSFHPMPAVLPILTEFTNESAVPALGGAA
jgi:zinc/manganese transport system substrate-binding protein